MKTLTLPLKKKWFEMIQRGEKLEEYREMSFYWLNRLYKENPPNGPEIKDFDKLVFTLGYPKANDTRRRLEFKNPDVHVGTGHPEWGAEPGKIYFVITWEA